MKTFLKKYWKPLAGVVGMAILIVYSAGTCNPKVGPADARPVARPAVPAGAETLTVRSEAVAPHIEVVGTVSSAEKIAISARLSAYVREVLVSAGSAVKKGDPILTLDDREIGEQLRGAEAQLDQATKEYERAAQLLKANATTEQAFTAAESGFKSAQARAEQARVMLSFTRIVSPIDGIVTDRRLEAGDLANPGQLLATVYDPTRLRIEAPVPVRLARKLNVGQEVDIQVENAGEPIKGKVTQIVSEIEPMSRTQTIKAELPGEKLAIVPGSFGRIILSDDARPGILVPADAVSRVGQLELVRVVRDGGVEDRLVKTGERHGTRIEIVSGLADGDTILVNAAKKAE